MKTRLRRSLKALLLGSLLSVSLAAMPPAWASISAEQAFSDLTSAASATGPGYYQTGERNMMVAGSLRVWVPQSNVQLISLVPPSFAAGCGGISAYFGGFSFINGANFQQLVTQVMQNAVGYVLELAIRSLCPMCADVLDAMQKAASTANKFGANSCDIAENLVNAAAKHVRGSLKHGAQGSAEIHLCSKESSNVGQSTGYLSSMADGLCSTTQAASSWWNNWVGGLGQSAKDSEETDNASVFGNTMWILLTEQGYADTDIKELILNLTGFTIKSKDGSADIQVTDAPLTPKSYIDALLYGYNPAGMATMLSGSKSMALLAQDYATAAKDDTYLKKGLYICENKAGGSPAPALTPYGQSPGGTDSLDWCNSFTYVPVTSLGSNPNFGLIGSYGLLYDVGYELSLAVQDVQNNQPIPPAAFDLMQLTPLPVYQMVNLAAVYPDVAADFVASYSKMIALEIAESVTLKGIGDATEPVAGASATPGPGAMRGLYKIVQHLKSQTDVITKRLKSSIAMEEGIYQDIQLIQHVISEQATQNGIEGGMLFSRGLAASVAQGH